jgi:hypothetical protein
MTDTRSIKEIALDEIRKEKADEAKTRIKAQMRIVESARQVYENEQRKLDDIMAAIDEGN